MALFPALLALASWLPGGADVIRTIITALSRAWILERIAAAAEPFLHGDDMIAGYRRLLELYRLLDPGLTQRLAYRALGQRDPEIQEAGTDFLRAVKSNY